MLGTGAGVLLFRGLTAAASLKQEVLVDADQAHVVLFRGLTAAASLKLQGGARALDKVVELFRGLTAAASLKRAANHAACGGSRRPALPRPHRRGLIEASHAASTPPATSLFRGLTAAASLKPGLALRLRSIARNRSSAASPPRPH